MTTLKYNAFDGWRKKNSSDAVPQIYLIFGESFLVKEIFEKVSAFISGDNQGQFAVETLEGGSVRMGDIIEEISTFSFLVKKKIVAVKKIPLFQAGNIAGEINYSASDHDLLSNFITGGIPEDHYLILTCASVDKRKKIYKTIEKEALVVDCSVAQGARRVDLEEQNLALKNLAVSILKESKKTLPPNAFNRLVKLTGFNLELFSQNLGKLVAYSGNNKEISIDDVNKVIVRDKKDPIFQLTNSMMDKDTAASLFYFNSLFKDGFHPLQILKSMENQIRKLLLVKCFVEHAGKGRPLSGFKKMGFNTFKQGVIPKIVEHDMAIKEELKAAEQFEIDEKAKKKKQPAIDLLLAPNPKNPYPVYQVFLKSENFSLSQLNQALIFLSDLDFRLKSSAIDAKTQIENFIIHLCSKGGFVYDTQEHQNRRHHI